MTNKDMLIKYRDNIAKIEPDENGNIQFGQYDMVNKEYLLQLLEEKINAS